LQTKFGLNYCAHYKTTISQAAAQDAPHVLNARGGAIEQAQVLGRK
jgi:hypothetical protein